MHYSRIMVAAVSNRSSHEASMGRHGDFESRRWRAVPAPRGPYAVRKKDLFGTGNPNTPLSRRLGGFVYQLLTILPPLLLM